MLEYLKKVGFRLNESNDVSLQRNYRFPTVSAKLDEDDEQIIFVLSYFVSDDYAKQQIEFDFYDFLADKKSICPREFPDFFDYFSISQTLLSKVYKSRLKGRKAWKKRNWELSVRWANVRKAFGIVKKVGSGGSGVSVGSLEALNKILNDCIDKAAKDYSYLPFNLYFETLKKKKALLRDNVGSRLTRDKAFKEFVSLVTSKQKG